MALRITLNQRLLGKWLVAIGGRLDSQNYTQAEAQIAPLLTEKDARVVFDLADLEYISSMGLRVIMKAAKAIRAGGGDLVLSNLQPQIQRVFEIAQALPPQQIFASVAEADHYFDVMQKRVLSGQDE